MDHACCSEPLKDVGQRPFTLHRESDQRGIEAGERATEVVPAGWSGAVSAHVGVIFSNSDQPLLHAVTRLAGNGHCLRARGARRVDKTLRDRWRNNRVIGAAEMNLWNARDLPRKIDRILRLGHRRYAMQPVDVSIIEIARDGSNRRNVRAARSDQHNDRTAARTPDQLDRLPRRERGEMADSFIPTTSANS